MRLIADYTLGTIIVLAHLVMCALRGDEVHLLKHR
jgi:hypothetical protein